GIIRKVLESAIANAEHNDGADIDTLKVKTIFVERGTFLKRFQARAKGRGNRVLKHTCNVFITAGDAMDQKINPIGFRLAVNRNWSSRWYANSRSFAPTRAEDVQVRDFPH